MIIRHFGLPKLNGLEQSLRSRHNAFNNVTLSHPSAHTNPRKMKKHYGWFTMKIRKTCFPVICSKIASLIHSAVSFILRSALVQVRHSGHGTED